MRADLKVQQSVSSERALGQLERAQRAGEGITRFDTRRN